MVLSVKVVVAVGREMAAEGSGGRVGGGSGGGRGGGGGGGGHGRCPPVSPKRPPSY